MNGTSDFSQVKLFGMFPFEVFKIKFDFAHILFNISAWIQIFVGSDTFLFVVNTDQNNGNLSVTMTPASRSIFA